MNDRPTVYERMTEEGLTLTSRIKELEAERDAAKVALAEERASDIANWRLIQAAQDRDEARAVARQLYDMDFENIDEKRFPWLNND